MGVFRAVKYLFIPTAIIASLSYISNNSIERIIKVKVHEPVAIKRLLKTPKDFNMHRSKSLESSVKEEFKKYSVLMPSSLNIKDTKRFIDGVVKGLDLSSRDVLNIIVFGNSSYNSQGKKFRVKKDIEKKFDFLYKHLPKYSGKFNLNVSRRIIDYNKIGYINGLKLLNTLLGQHFNSDYIYSIGHGLTVFDGFITFANDSDKAGGRENYFFKWKHYFNKKEWLDVSCGSTSSVDRYSHKHKNLFDNDGLVRFFSELHLYIRDGFKIKQVMLEDYLNQKPKN